VARSDLDLDLDLVTPHRIVNIVIIDDNNCETGPNLSSTLADFTLFYR